MRPYIVAVPFWLILLVCLCPIAEGDELALLPEPFSSQANFMSLPGYLRWRNLLETGDWLCGGQVRLCEFYVDNQEGNPEAISGMDINSISKVRYTLSVNGSPARALAYNASILQYEGIVGDVIKINFPETFCIGRNYKYLLTTYVDKGGLTDMVGNGFNDEYRAGEAATRSWDYSFSLVYGNDGRVNYLNLKTGRQFPLFAKGGWTYLTSPEDFILSGAAKDAQFRESVQRKVARQAASKEYREQLQKEFRRNLVPKPLFKPLPRDKFNLRK